MEQAKIIFLTLPQVQLLDLAGPDQVFLEAMEQGAALAIEYCSIEKEITTSAGLNIHRLQRFDKVSVRKGDYVFIPGTQLSFLTARSLPYEKELRLWLLDACQKGAVICSVCSGAFLLARLGLLNDKKCTTHWKRTKELKVKYPAIILEEDILFTEDDNIFTSAGVAAGIDLALHILARLKGEHFAFKVARELVIYTRRSGREPQQSLFMQYRNHIHSGVHKVQDCLEENIQKKYTLTDLGEVACMSERNLTRTFKRETGITVNEYVTLIRKEYLKQLDKNPDITRKQMALLCGLKSERQVIRLLNSIH